MQRVRWQRAMSKGTWPVWALPALTVGWAWAEAVDRPASKPGERAVEHCASIDLEEGTLCLM